MLKRSAILLTSSCLLLASIPRLPQRATRQLSRTFDTLTAGRLFTSSATSNSKMLVLLDWDETLTSHDTLAQIAPPDGSHAGPSFAHYSKEYMSDYESHVQTYRDPDVKSIKTIAEQFDFLGSLAEVELKSNQRIEEGGLFKGWDPAAAEKRARTLVQLRPGVKDSLQRFLLAHKETVQAGVISVSWSTVFVRAGLGVKHVKDEEPQLQSAGNHDEGDAFPLHFLRSNTIDLDPQTHLGTGKMSKSGTSGVRTGLDKLREMSKVLSKTGPQLTVYAGDSNTDLPCLLYASVGLILGDNKSLQSTLERLGLADSVVNGFEAFQSRFKASHANVEAIKSDQNDGKDLLSLLEAKKAEDFFLVRVGDWHEGTKVLETLLDHSEQ